MHGVSLLLCIIWIKWGIKSVEPATFLLCGVNEKWIFVLQKFYLRYKLLFNVVYAGKKADYGLLLMQTAHFFRYTKV